MSRLSLWVAVLVLAQTSFAAALPRGGLRSKGAPPSPVLNNLKVERVRIAGEYKTSFEFSMSRACNADQFAGTFSGNSIYLKAEATGGSGVYIHDLYYTFGESYQISTGQRGQISKSRRGNGEFKVLLPKLKDNIPYIMQSFILVTRDSQGGTNTFEKTIKVSRPLILTVSTDEDSMKRNCHQVFPSHLSSEIPPQTNWSTSVSSLEITLQNEGSSGSTRGGQFGVTISPLSYAGFSSLFYINSSAYIQKTNLRAQRTSYSSKYELKPGEILEVYDQSLLSFVSYDATLVEPCGKEELKKGIYLLQEWETLHHVHVRNPKEPSPLAESPSGLPVENTCMSSL